MSYILLLFVSVSQTLDLPPGLLASLCFVESHHKVSAYNQHDGGSPSVGICQVKESAARQVGFKGTIEQLKDPAINILYAGKYLRLKLNKYYDVRMAVAGYNAGTPRLNAQGLIMNRKYVEKVFTQWVRTR